MKKRKERERNIRWIIKNSPLPLLGPLEGGLFRAREGFI